MSRKIKIILMINELKKYNETNNVKIKYNEKTINELEGHLAKAKLKQELKKVIGISTEQKLELDKTWKMKLQRGEQF